MSKFQKWKANILSPFTQFTNLLIGLSEAELAKKGEIRQLLYSYDMDINKAAATQKATHSNELLDAIEVNNIHIETVDGEDVAKVEVAMNVFITNNEYRPLKQISYPLEWAFGYVMSLFILTILAAHYFNLNMNILVYFIVVEWVLILLVLYNIAAKRKFLWAYASNETFNKKGLLQWLQKNNQLFVDVDLIRENKDQLKKTEGNTAD